MRRIDLAGFADKFADDTDPWGTFSDRDEAIKRAAILHGLGPGPLGRVLELASGNGSNSAAIAPRALRLDATEGTAEGTTLTRNAISAWSRARAIELALPARFPGITYDAIVVAELLYYLSSRTMAHVAGCVTETLRPGGRLVLAHHRVDFYDFTQRSSGIHERFLQMTNSSWSVRTVRQRRDWCVLVADRS